MPKGYKLDNGYGTASNLGGKSYTEISEIMTTRGDKMNHSTARNVFLSSMKQIASEVCALHGEDVSDKDMYKIAKMSEKTKDHLWILPEIQHAHISIQKNVFQSVQYKTSSKYYRIEDAKFVRDVFNFYGKKEDTIVFVQANYSTSALKNRVPCINSRFLPYNSQK